MGPLIVPDLADLLVGCRLVLNERRSSTEPACNATGQTQTITHTHNIKSLLEQKPKRGEFIIYILYNFKVIQNHVVGR